MELVHTIATAHKLFRDGETRRVRLAVEHDSAILRQTVALTPAGELSVDASDCGGPIDWFCGGKPLLAYAAMRAVTGAGLALDADLHPLVSAATADWPGITLIELLTYRSGLLRGNPPGTTLVVAKPRLSRLPGWNPAANAQYSNVPWDLLPPIIEAATGRPFQVFFLHVLRDEFGIERVTLRRTAIEPYRDRAAIWDDSVRRVIVPTDVGTSVAGPLDDLCRFYAALNRKFERWAGTQPLAQSFLGPYPGPEMFGTGISQKRTWGLGLMSNLAQSGFKHILGTDSFGAQGAPLTLTTDRQISYAWNLVGGVMTCSAGAFAIAIDGLRPTRDLRYPTMLAALHADLGL